MIALGIDIGITGAVAAVDHHSTARIDDIPTSPVPGRRTVSREIDPLALMALIRTIVRPGEAAIAMIEDIHGGFGKGGAARASTMDSRGVVRAVCAIARIRVVSVPPGVWKRHYGLLKTEKAASLERARALYPAQAHMLKRQKDHNRAEALLLAHYAQGVLS